MSGSYFIHLLCFEYHSISSLILYIVKSFKQQVSKNEADCIWRRQTELTTAETLIMLISMQKCPQYFSDGQQHCVLNYESDNFVRTKILLSFISF